MTPRVARYAEEAALQHRTTAERIFSAGRCPNEVVARRHVMRRLRADGFSLTQIGTWMGRDPSTVLYNLRRGAA